MFRYLLASGWFNADPAFIVAGYAATRELGWLTPPPRYCVPLACYLPSIQYALPVLVLVLAFCSLVLAPCSYLRTISTVAIYVLVFYIWP